MKQAVPQYLMLQGTLRPFTITSTDWKNEWKPCGEGAIAEQGEKCGVLEISGGQKW